MASLPAAAAETEPLFWQLRKQAWWHAVVCRPPYIQRRQPPYIQRRQQCNDTSDTWTHRPARVQAKKPHMATLSLLVAAAETEEASMRPLLANLYAADSANDFAAAVSKAAPQ